jgi:hypothetical protein
MKTLVIIGNGFDVQHGMNTRYSDFREYLMLNDREIYDVVEKYLYVDRDFWHDFESRLEDLDSDEILNHAENFLVSYGADDWSDSLHHDYEYEIEEIVSNLSGRLLRAFSDWLKSVAPASGSAFRSILPSDRFLTFNYTDTLQRIYGVPEVNILHIHGAIHLSPENIILGHARELDANEKFSRLVDEETDVRVAGGYEIIDEYFARTFKPTAKIIQANSHFFDSLGVVDEVRVIGHSLSDVDLPYLKKVALSVHQNARWTISFYRDATPLRSRAEKIGLDFQKLRFVASSQM